MLHVYLLTAGQLIIYITYHSILFFISKYHVGEVCLIHAPKIVMKESLAPTHTCESFKSRMCVGDFTIQRDIRPPQIPFNSRVMHLFFSLSPASIHTFIMRCL